MRIANLLHFTENHRFYVYRDFSLGGLDHKVLSSMYQPMVGAFAIGLYMLLYHQVPADKVGYSELEQQRKLFLGLDLEPGEKGRKYLIEQTSKLEAVGLLQTHRKYVPQSDDYIYGYRLNEPLSPDEFFKNQHLTLLLRDKIGKYMVLFLREQFHAKEPDELYGRDLNTEDLTVPFYELFRLNTHTIDYELEQALFEAAPAVQKEQGIPAAKGFSYADIIMRFPRESFNRAFVERLKYDADQLATVNYVAKKYDLSLQETCRLLDEDGIFDEDGTLNVDAMQYKANLYFRQDKRREEDRGRLLQKTADTKAAEPAQEEKSVEMAYYLDVPAVFQGQCDIHQYNALLRNEPYTRILKKFFPGSVPEPIMDTFERIDLNYKLKEEVINVLIHYLKAYNLSWSRGYIEAIAADMLGKQIDTYEQAVQYVRDAVKAKEKPSGKTSSRGRGKQKPKIPIISDVPQEAPITDEELEEIRKKARKLTENKR